MVLLELAVAFLVMCVASYVGTTVALHYYFEDDGPDSSNAVSIEHGRND